MAQIIWTASATNDMDEIAGYIALSNINAAKKLIKNIKTKVERLELFPESGRVPEDSVKQSYREVVINPCRVFYRIEDDKVFIIRVLRQERDLRNYIIQESEGEYVVDRQ